MIVIFLLAGCEDDHYPPRPGGGVTPGGGGDGGTSTPIGDAGPDEVTISGRVCLITDMRSPFACPTTDVTGTPIDLSGITVRDRVLLGQATTGTDGTFTMNLSRQSSVDLIVSHATLRTSIITIDLSGPLTDIKLPAIDSQTWLDLTDFLGVLEPADHGAVAVFVSRNTAPLAGVEILQPIGGRYAAFYDGATALDWIDSGLTGPFGAGMLFGVPRSIGGTSFSVVGPSGNPPLTDVPVVVDDNATTFAFRPL